MDLRRGRHSEPDRRSRTRHVMGDALGFVGMVCRAILGPIGEAIGDAVLEWVGCVVLGGVVVLCGAVAWWLFGGLVPV